MGPYNVTGLPLERAASIFRVHVKIDPECSSKTFIAVYHTVRRSNSDGIMNPHHCEHLQSIPQNMKKKWSVDGNVKLGKLD
jgi:hypothetical protein